MIVDRLAPEAGRFPAGLVASAPGGDRALPRRCWPAPATVLMSCP